MNILVTGKGSGSFEIRGRQLGEAIGATVEKVPESVEGFDAAIVVKRQRPEVMQKLRGLPIVWDVLDSYPQPAALTWDKSACREWLYRQIEEIRPTAIVAATNAMAKDLSQFPGSVLVLPHHARPGQGTNPLRDTVKVVGYQGGDYLGRWKDIIEQQCAARGWTFRVDHSKTAEMNLADVDIVVAVRDQTGYAARHWKSGVKLANAQGSGTPSIVCREAGYLETASARQYFADDEAQLSASFDALTSVEARRDEVEKYRPITLERVASDYLAWLRRL